MGAWSMALIILLTMVALLVIYLFYAVIHPEKF
ncbi:MAG: K(+)-transporting ATPase subunit F [Acetobacteraceae bacterium]|jgi:K+-transporting ATPase KdpF subunit